MKKNQLHYFQLKVNKKQSGFSILRFLMSLIFLLLLITANLIAQDIDLSRAKGEVIAQGTNETLIKGEGFKVKSYRIEKLPLSQSTKPNSEDGNQKTENVAAIRLVVTGEFPSGVYVIWINGVPRYAYIGVDGNLQLTRIGNGNFFEENSEIAVSRGSEIESEKIFLLEPFRVPSNIQKPARSKEELKRGVSLSYIGCDGALLTTEKNCIKIEIRNSSLPDNSGSNYSWVLQIGNKEFIGGGSFIISARDFAKLKDNEWVVVKRDKGISGGMTVGILDKSSLGNR